MPGRLTTTVLSRMPIAPAFAMPPSAVSAVGARGRPRSPFEEAVRLAIGFDAEEERRIDARDDGGEELSFVAARLTDDEHFPAPVASHHPGPHARTTRHRADGALVRLERRA